MVRRGVFTGADRNRKKLGLKCPYKGWQVPSAHILRAYCTTRFMLRIQITSFIERGRVLRSWTVAGVRVNQSTNRSRKHQITFGICRPT